MRLLNNIKYHKNWSIYYRYKFFNKNLPELTFKTRKGLSITVPKRLVQTYKECFFDETYTKGLPENALGHYPVVVDIGANVGYFSLFFLNKYPKSTVFSFEPMPVNFKLLSKYNAENSVLNFTVINKAVSNKNETITLTYDASDSFTTSASIFENKAQKDSIQVECTTLENIMRENTLHKIDFLKLDCEGSEYPILYNCPKNILDKIMAISIETHAGKGETENIHALSQFLKENGYTLKTEKDIIWAWR